MSLFGLKGKGKIAIDNRFVSPFLSWIDDGDKSRLKAPSRKRLYSFEELADLLESACLLFFKLRSDRFKLLDRFFRIHPLSAMQADFCLYREHRAVRAPSQQLIHLFLREFSTTDWAFVKRNHAHLSFHANLSTSAGPACRLL